MLLNTQKVNWIQSVLRNEQDCSKKGLTWWDFKSCKQQIYIYHIYMVFFPQASKQYWLFDYSPQNYFYQREDRVTSYKLTIVTLPLNLEVCCFCNMTAGKALSDILPEPCTEISVIQWSCWLLKTLPCASTFMFSQHSKLHLSNPISVEYFPQSKIPTIQHFN